MVDRHNPDRDALLAVLGLPGDADEPDIVRAYRRLARETHPDVDSRTGVDATAPDFVEVSDAYHRLLGSAAPAPPPPPTPTPPSPAPVHQRSAQPMRRPPLRGPANPRPPIVAGPVTVTPPDPRPRGES